MVGFDASKCSFLAQILFSLRCVLIPRLCRAFSSRSAVSPSSRLNDGMAISCCKRSTACWCNVFVSVINVGAKIRRRCWNVVRLKSCNVKECVHMLTLQHSNLTTTIPHSIFEYFLVSRIVIYSTSERAMQMVMYQ